MSLFNLEHGKLAYRADFALYGAAVLTLFALVTLVGSHHDASGLWLWLWVGGGALGWTLIEYLLHRFILHGMQPFRRWHGAHHERPMALICAPTLLSATLILALVFLPAVLTGGLWRACSLTLGVLVGYFGYAVTHHATHHWRSGNEWLNERKRWHAAHHHGRTPGCFGVTGAFWDQVFGTAPAARRVVASPGHAGSDAQDPVRAREDAAHDNPVP